MDDAAVDLRRHLQREKYTQRKNWGKFLVFIGFLLCALWFIPFVPSLFFETISVQRLDAKGNPVSIDVGPGTKQWISISKVSKHVVNAIVVAEDAKFFQHHGFDFESIQKAIQVNREKGRYARGASTISQQVIKMVFLSREKTIIRKAREAVGTIVLELLMSKDRILEWYINLCEFGGGVYGVKPAGQFYFKTRPELLTIEQAVHLAVVIPSPNKWSKGLRAKALTPFGKKRFSRIIQNMFLSGYITEVQKDTALARGDFGNPVFSPASDFLDEDCAGDAECEDGLNESSHDAGPEGVTGKESPKSSDISPTFDHVAQPSSEKAPSQDSSENAGANEVAHPDTIVPAEDGNVR